jgi:hypothetical protein
MLIPPTTRLLTKPTANLTLGNTPLSVVDNQKILGVIFTNNLRWDLQFSNIRRKVGRMIGILHRFSHTKNYDYCQKIFKRLSNLILSTAIRYRVMPVPGQLTAMDRTLLHAHRVIVNNKSAELTKSNFYSTGLIPFKDLLLYNNVCFIHKTLSNNQLENYIGSTLVYNRSTKLTRNVFDQKINIITHNRTSEEHCL